MREIDIPKGLETIYQKKPDATLSLLHEIVKGGRPGDALAAIAFGVSLVKGPQYGVPYTHMSDDLVDYIPKNATDSVRDRMSNAMSELRKNRSSTPAKE